MLGATAVTAASLTLTGCFYISPAQTDSTYQPADGTDSQVGDVSLNNVLLVTSAKGARGQLQGMVTNNADAPVTVQVKPAGGTAVSLQIPAQGAVRLDGKASGDNNRSSQPVTVATTPAAPGSTTTVQFSTGQAGVTDVTVPVVLDQPPYGSASVEHDEDTHTAEH